MANARLLMLLALLACLLAATFARADATDDDFDAEASGNAEEEAEDDFVAETKDQAQQVDARVYFADYDISEYSSLKLPAGEKVRTFVSFQNKAGAAPAQIFIVAAHLNQLGNPDAFVQNFSAVRSLRTVNGGETATVQYDFRPDALLEPMDYNLVIRVFFLNEENATFVAAAYNSTISITDPLGTDFKAITTYLILAAIIGGTVYFFTKSDATVLAPKKGSAISAIAAAAKKDNSATITDDKTYNKDYISPEHLKYREQLLKQAAARGGSPKAAAKKK